MTLRSKPHIKPTLESLEQRDVPAIFNVTANVADGAPGSLRAAIIAANGNGEDDTINLAAGIYNLTIANSNGQENAAAQGDLDLTEVNHTVTLQGQGVGASVIDGGQLDRVFQVQQNTKAVFRDLTIRNGVAGDFGDAGAPTTLSAFGGGILNFGNTVVEKIVIENCSAIGTVPAGNEGAGGGFGGGICNFGSLNVSQSTLRSNQATGARGTANYGGYANGGGIASQGTLSVAQSTISGNVARGGRGGEGTNNFGGTGGEGGYGGWAFGGGIYIWQNSQASVVINSTISGNQVISGDGGQGGFGGVQGGRGGNAGNAYGGGLYVHSPLTLANSTVADNHVTGGTGGPAGDGGSLADNGFNGVALGGGVWTLTDNPVLTSISNIIANNTTSGQGWSDVQGAFVSISHTLLRTSEGATIPTGSVGNEFDVDPMLGPLADNGGPTQTHALAPGSHAVNTGSNPFGVTVDQRGFGPRAVGTVDKGAFELGAVPFTPPTTPPTPPSLVAQLGIGKIRKAKFLQVTIRDAVTGEIKAQLRSPFQRQKYRQITAAVVDTNGDGIPDAIRFTGRRRFGPRRRIYTRYISL